MYLSAEKHTFCQMGGCRMIRRHVPIYLPGTVSQTVPAAASFILCYRLIETTEWLTAKENRSLDTVYSLMISKIECAVITEESYIYDVSRNENDAVTLFEKLVNGGVTPCALFDVVAENIESDEPRCVLKDAEQSVSAGYLKLEKGVSTL